MSTETRARVFLVTLRFPPHGVPAPELLEVRGPSTLAGLLTALREGRAALPEWSWGEALEAGAESARDVSAWVLARTKASVARAAEDHLVQCVDEEPDGTVVARYLFDAVYASAHPQALDREHLALLHGTIAAKMLDEGDVILDRDGLAASLRWVKQSARGVRLSREGGRG